MTNTSNDGEPLRELERALEFYLDTRALNSDGSILLIKRKLDTIDDLRIILRTKDHPPPHFHVISLQRNIDARFSIETLEVLSEKHYGRKITSDDIKKIQGFYRENPERYEVLKREYAKTVE